MYLDTVTYFQDELVSNKFENNYLFSDSFSLTINQAKQKLFEQSKKNQLQSISFPILDRNRLISYSLFIDEMQHYKSIIPVDDDDFIPPTTHLLNMIQLVLLEFLFSNIPAPKPMLLHDGVVGAYWKKGKSYLSIDFDDSGDYPWAGTTDGIHYVSGLFNVKDKSALVSFQKMLG